MPAKPSKLQCPYVPVILEYYATDNERLLTPILEDLIREFKGYSWKLGLHDFDLVCDLAQISAVDILLKFRQRKYIIDPEEEQGSGKFWAWAYQILRLNAAEARQRKNSRPTPFESEDSLILIDGLPDPESSSEYTLHKQDAINVIVATTKAAFSIHPLDQQAMFYVYYKGYTMRDAGAIIGVDEEIVSRRVGKALRRVRLQLLSLGFRPTVDLYRAIAWVDTEGLFAYKEPKLNKRAEESLSSLGRVSSLRRDLHLT
jgi:DNA-directed RNA polymerase specialized sigma24 family protein